jgi:6-phosphogluconolactonase (cycloisomerase 2 family)
MMPAASLAELRAWLLGEAKTHLPVKSIATLLLITVIVGLGVCGCQGGGSTAPPSGSNPSAQTNSATISATISAISPTSAVAGSAAFTLTVFGTNFNASSMISFGGAMLTTTFVYSSQLTAVIPAAAIASTGSATVTVTGTSNTASFTVTSGTNPIPTISTLDPICAPAGAQAFTLSVSGSNFGAGSVVRWNGSNRPTQVFTSTGIGAVIPASDIATAGTATVTVFNSAPGGGSSNSSTLTVAAGGVNPQSIAVDPTGKFAYVANEGCPDAFGGEVSMYTIDPTNGTLTSAGPPVTTGDFGADSVAVDPSGKFVYVANWGESDTAGSISAYTINGTTGTLTLTGTIQAPCAPPPSPGGCSPWSVAVDPSGRFAYVANEGGFTPTSTSIATINPATGTLTFTGAIAAGGRATSVTVDPTGKFVYVTDGLQNSNGSPGVGVSMYTVNPTTGGLTSIGTIAAGASPSSIAIDPSLKFAYVTNSGSNDFSMYSVDATTGALTSLGSIAAGTNPSSVAVDPTGNFAYVANSGSNDVSIYAIDATTGVLTFIGAVDAGLSPSSVAIGPSGKFAYVTNYGSDNISVYGIDPTTGALTLIGTIGT